MDIILKHAFMLWYFPIQPFKQQVDMNWVKYCIH